MKRLAAPNSTYIHTSASQLTFEGDEPSSGVFGQVDVEEAHLLGGDFPRDDFPTNADAAEFRGQDPGFVVGTQFGVENRLPVPHDWRGRVS